MDNTNTWKIIDKYFEDNPQGLVRHHIESYNDFFKRGIFQIFKEKNPLRIQTRYDTDIDEYRSQCIMYFGGKDGSKIYFGKPVIYDDNNSHFMYPNEARLRNMTYGITVHYDVEVEFIDILKDGEKPTIVGDDTILEEADSEIEGGSKTKAPLRRKRAKRTEVDLTPMEAALFKDATNKSMMSSNVQKRTIILDQIFLGRFPIMVQSNHCILNGLPREVRHTMGECSNDMGGYFIINGKEKTVVSQEKFGDNMLYIRNVDDDTYLYSAEIRSVSENVSKPIRTLSVKMMKPTDKFSFKNIVVNIPNVRKPIPLFIVFRALGIISDKQIITMCLLDLHKYADMVDLFIPSVHDAGGIMTQQTALKYIATHIKGSTIPHALEILADYFLPHVGEMNYLQKGYYLGHIVFKLLSVYTGIEQPTDRDNFKYKRIELVGTLMYDLFREYYTMQQKQIHLSFEEIIYFNQSLYADNLYGLIQQNYKEVFNNRIVESGFKTAFNGNWGAKAHTKRIGVVQDLNRLTFYSALSHLRKTNLPLDASVKVVGPRVLHMTQWGFFDPIDTPDGGNIGLHKHMAITAYITQGYSREIIIKWLREKGSMKILEECTPKLISALTKVIVNGHWAGVIDQPFEIIQKIKLFRRNALIPIYTSATFDIKNNTVFIYTDAGRICRPIFYKDDETGKMSYDNKNFNKYLNDDSFTWENLITGFNKKKIDNFNPNNNKLYELDELYDVNNDETNPAKLQKFLQDKSIIDYIDTNETEGSLIAMNLKEMDNHKHQNFTHIEIHESLIFGVLTNLVNYPENNPATRNSFSCGQTKQSCSIYHTNHQVRMDKMAAVLTYGQIPLVKTRYLKHINNEENPYGENAIVAVMCYTGYNVEDAILVNEGSLKRGLFRTTYYTTYESHEEKSKSKNITTEIAFTNIENTIGVTGMKPGYDYSYLDKSGIIRENTKLNDKIVMIGLTNRSSENSYITDASKMPKKGQMGVVDKTFITDGEDGTRIAKVRVREERIPNLGDKMASRAGQKGTIGLVIPESDMPFNKDGIRPDLIINPHAIPSRMTIGQFVETITGKASAIYGGFGDCTAYNNDGSKIGVFGELLCKSGYHSSGNEILYSGMTGQQLEAEIFMGPNYYMRLKHMVKDKINYRARGPNQQLTRQPVSGRANDGGLRIGEMERDGVISHGASAFLKESMMERADKYKLAICNTTGLTAIYNPAKNIFISPMADGPVKFTDNINEQMSIETVTRFGRNFSTIDVPFAFKLLLQELQTINIQMRIITEDNIDQFDNMAYSTNINLLTNNPDATAESIIKNIKTALRNNTSVNNFNKIPDSVDIDTDIVNDIVCSSKTDENEDIWPESPDYPPPGSPAYPPPESPAYPPESPPYAPYSPAYNPNPSVSSNIDSPPYNPNSPPYNPNTPPYNPNSPGIVDNQMDSPPYAPYSPYVEKFNKGDDVFFRGDMLPSRVWTITNVGVEYITISTLNTTGLDVTDRIKVVSRADIYKPTEVDNVKDNDPIYPVPNIVEKTPDIKIPESSNTPGGIHIKIVNGNDLAGSTPVESGKEFSITPEDINPSVINSNTTEPTPIIPAKTVTDGAAIDGGIVIKKV